LKPKRKNLFTGHINPINRPAIIWRVRQSQNRNAHHATPAHAFRDDWGSLPRGQHSEDGNRCDHNHQDRNRSRGEPTMSEWCKSLAFVGNAEEASILLGPITTGALKFE
jgi:hypothetical protein